MLNKLLGRKKEKVHGNHALSAVPYPELTLSLVKSEIEPPPLPLISPVVGMLGSKGGVGATTLAFNLAAALCRQGISPTLLDANFHQPDIGTMIGEESPYSLKQLLDRAPDIDKNMFQACSIEVTEGSTSYGLLTPPLGEIMLNANLSQLASCLEHIRSYSDWWLIDMPKHLDKHFVNLADMCDKILLVFEATVTGVASCRRWLRVFRDLGYGQERILCILNRAGSKHSAIEAHLKDCFQDEPIFRVPNARTLTWESSLHGVPAVFTHPNHPYSRAVMKLATQISKETDNKSV